MERNAKFVFVGFFTILCAVGLSLFAFWIGKYGVDEYKYDSYKTYLQESVSGLKVSSPVKLKGIDVGFVEAIKIDQANPEHVEIFFKVDKDTPVKIDSVVILNSQGIAGVGFLEIKNGTKNSDSLKKIDKSERPQVKSELSTIAKLTDKAELVLLDIQKTVLKIDKLASEKNIENISRSLENIADITSSFKNDKKEFSSVLKKANSVLDETKNFATTGTLLLKEVHKSNAIEKLSLTLEASQEAMLELKNLAVESSLAVQQLKESPSDFLFKRKSTIVGPGE